MGKRYPIRIPSWHEKRLIWWAHCKGQSKTMMSQNIIQARVEANESQIESMLADLAGELGIKVDDLKASILDNSGFTPEDE
jgi:predicted DsbA family dithiol-disulfide isomerase